MLSFTDFMKVFSAYEQYVQTQPTVPTPALQPQPQPMPTVPTPAPQPRPMPTVPTPALQPQPISMDEYVRRLDEFEQRLSAQEKKPPMPTISTPKPATVDDIILGIVGKENRNGKQ